MTPVFSYYGMHSIQQITFLPGAQQKTISPDYIQLYKALPIWLKAKNS